MMNVTIGVPIRNAEKHLPYTLKCFSLLDYPQENFEIIFINHGSDDSSREMITKFSKGRKNVRIIDIPFDGPNRSHVRNQIIKYSDNELIIFVDQDVLVLPDFIEQHVRIHEKYNKCLVTGQIYGKEIPYESNIMEEYIIDIKKNISTLKNDSIFSDFRVVNNLVSNKDSYTVFDSNMSAWRFFWTTNMSIKKKCLEELPFEEGFNGWGVEDEEFSYRHCCNDHLLIYSRDACGIHNPHEINSEDNNVSWHNNMSFFLKKYNNREIEFYYMFLIFLDNELKNLDFNLNRINKNKILNLYKRSILILKDTLIGENNVAFFLEDFEIANKLQIKNVMNPYLNKRDVPKKNQYVTMYSTFGINLPYNNNFFDTGLVPFDILQTISLPFSRLFILEFMRVVKNPIFIMDSTSSVQINQSFRSLLETFSKEIKFITV